MSAHASILASADIFEIGSTLGSLVAENDQFLDECFLDKGDLEILGDLGDHRCVVIGRTGAGKSAILQKLRVAREERVIAVDPNDLSLSYISNDNVLNTFEALGINLAPFYRLLWKHVFVTEITKKIYGLTNQQKNDNFLRFLGELVRRDRAKEEAVSYFREWGDKFWETTEFRVREVTRNLTQRLEVAMGGSITIPLPSGQGIAELSRKKAGELSEEQKGEIIHLGQRVIQDIQISKLNRVIELLETDILTERQRYYYIVIDKLDENWVEDSLRYQMIFELLSVVYELNNKLRHKLKILVALREDLLQRVYDYMRYVKKQQFQQEKFEDGYYRLGWDPTDLKNVIRKRVEYLFLKGLSPEQLTLEDVFATKMVFERFLPSRDPKYTPIDYILDRTMLTPRDSIRFFNRCLEIVRTSDSGKFTKTTILNAEKLYSDDRLNALIDEWRVNYPNLKVLFDLLSGLPPSFDIVQLEDMVQRRLDEVFSRMEHDTCPIRTLIERVYSPDDLSVEKLLSELFYILFAIGVIGIERHNNGVVYWSFKENRISIQDLYERSTTLYVHPGLYSALSIQLKK